MDADFSIELGPDDPVLDFPWTDPTGKLAYFDVKRHPELIAQIVEAQEFPELRDFLRAMNSARVRVETAKCDTWATTELSKEEDVYDAPCKFASYVDLVFTDGDARQSLPAYEEFVRRLVELLRRAPDISASIEACIRRCYIGGAGDVREGFYLTLYVNGYGEDETNARMKWAVALRLAGNAIVQLSTRT